MKAAEDWQSGLQERFRHWRDNPDDFVREVFTGDPSLPDVVPEPWQVEALRAIAAENRIAIRSGHGVGKTTFLAWAILWFLLTHYPAKIPATAPTAHQLEDVLWAELAAWHRRLHPALRQLVTLKSGRLDFTAAPEESFAVARTARREQPEAFQGFHAKHLLFIGDEASGIDDIVFQVGEGAMSTPNAKTILTGNPTRTQGYFYDAFHPVAGQRRWWTLKVGCDESSRVDPDYIEDMKARYGEDSNVYRVRVLGEFPKQDDDVVIPLEWIEQAKARDVEPIVGPVVWGVDVARYGSDRSAVAKRMMNHLLEPVVSWSQADLMQTTGRIVAMYETTIGHRRPKQILVDAIGYGAGVADRLKEQGLPAIAVNVSEKPGIGERYLRQRDELWFKAREWFQERDAVICDDETLIGELSSIRYTFTSNGKIRVEGKDEMKKRGLRSPDCFVAGTLVLTPQGERPIETLQVGDEVVTPWATRKVIKVWRSQTDTLTHTVFSNGASLAGRGKHRIFTWNAGWVRLDSLSLTNVIETSSRWRLFKWHTLAALIIGGSGTGFSRLVGTIPLTGKRTRSDYCIAASGRTTMGLSPTGTMSTISMAIGQITGLKTLRPSLAQSTTGCTWPSGLRIGNIVNKTGNSLTAPVKPRVSGTGQTRGVSGIASTASAPCLNESVLPFSAASAATASTPYGPVVQNTARGRVGNAQHTRAGTWILSALARGAEKALSRIGIGQRDIVPVSVQTGTASAEVYNLTLDDDNVYYANGILVSNCADAFVLTFAAASRFDRTWNKRAFEDGPRPKRTNSQRFNPLRWKR